MVCCTCCGKEVVGESCESCDRILSALEDVDEYKEISLPKSCLDGWFSADELRRIADVMDAVKASTTSG